MHALQGTSLPLLYLVLAGYSRDRGMKHHRTKIRQSIFSKTIWPSKDF